MNIVLLSHHPLRFLVNAFGIFRHLLENVVINLQNIAGGLGFQPQSSVRLLRCLKPKCFSSGRKKREYRFEISDQRNIGGHNRKLHINKVVKWNRFFIARFKLFGWWNVTSSEIPGAGGVIRGRNIKFDKVDLDLLRRENSVIGYHESSCENISGIERGLQCN